MTDARSRQPKGIPIGGEFASNSHDEAGGSLAAPAEPDIFAEVAQPLTIEETMDMVSDPGQYRQHRIDPFVVAGRPADFVAPTPSLRIDRDRPELEDEKEFSYALSRIDTLWSKDDSIDGRSEKIIADMRRSGALGEGASSAREAYARALVLNESGVIDEAQVSHLLDHIDGGGLDYKNQARALGYHPEQFLSDIHVAADAAEYRRVHADSDDAERAARVRSSTLHEHARQFQARADRAWTSREDDIERYRQAIGAMDAKLATLPLEDDVKGMAFTEEVVHNTRLDITAERDAYAFMLDKIEGRWSASA